jgi:tRNA dimethylallyltransferase
MFCTQKAIVVIGPTASGKSDAAIALAKERGGEVISVDSRQVYRGLDLGSGKVLRDQNPPQDSSQDSPADLFYSEGIRHHLLDIREPGESYNVSDFLRDAKKIEQEIRERGNVPIFCGGTLFWMDSCIHNSVFPPVAPNQELRQTLAQKTAPELFALLTKKDPARAQTIDPHNTVRLIRALEIIDALGSVPSATSLSTEARAKNLNQYEIIILTPERDILKERIQKRLAARIDQGLLAEVEGLLAAGVTHEWLEALGLEYTFFSRFLRGDITWEALETELLTAIWHYAKRQMTFLKKFTA